MIEIFRLDHSSACGHCFTVLITIYCHTIVDGTRTFQECALSRVPLFREFRNIYVGTSADVRENVSGSKAGDRATSTYVFRQLQITRGRSLRDCCSMTISARPFVAKRSAREIIYGRNGRAGPSRANFTPLDTTGNARRATRRGEGRGSFETAMLPRRG